MSFRFDSTGVSPDEFTLLPEGWYPFRIFDAEEMTSKNGNPMILAKCEVYGDERYSGVNVWHYVTFIPKGNKGDGINVHFRKCIGVPYGGLDDVNAKDWLGKKFMGFAVQETYDGKTRNKLSKVSPLNHEQAGNGASEDKEIPF